MTWNRRTLDGFTEYLSEEETETMKDRLYNKSLEILDNLCLDNSNRISGWISLNNCIGKCCSLHQTIAEIKYLLYNDLKNTSNKLCY